MRFLVDRCAGRRLAALLRDVGHDVLEARTLGPDPGDRALLAVAASENRVVITIDTDFGELIFHHRAPHAGLIRLPDVPAEQRIALVTEVIARYGQGLDNHAIVTIRGDRIRVSYSNSF